MEVQISLSHSVFIFLGCIIRGEISGSCGSFILNIEEPPYWFPWWLHQYTIPPTMLKGFVFPCPHQHLSCFFNASCSTRHQVMYLIVLISISLMISGAECPFMHLLAICTFFLWKYIYLGPVFMFKLDDYYSFCYWVVHVFLYFRY